MISQETDEKREGLRGRRGFGLEMWGPGSELGRVKWIVAEIADKMAGVFQLWLVQVFWSLPFLLGAFRVKGKAGSLVVICLAGGFSAVLAYGAVVEAFGAGSFSVAVRRELGAGWIAHSVSSAFLPLVLAAIVVALRRPWIRRGPH